MANELLDESLGLPEELQRRIMGLPRVALPQIQPQAGLPMPNLPQPQPLSRPAPVNPDEASPTIGVIRPWEQQTSLQRPAMGGSPNAPTADKTPMGAPENMHSAEIARLEQTGSGASQVKNPFLHGLAAVGDVAASIFPRIGAAIPGTTVHHNELLGQQEGLLNQDVKREQESAQTGAVNAETQVRQSEIPLHEAEAERAKAEAYKATHPKPEKEQNPEARAFDSYVAGGMTPQAAFKQVQQDRQEGIAAGKPEPEEKNYKQFADEYKQAHPNTTVAETQRAFKLNQEMPQRTPQVMVMVPQPGGGAQAEVIKPGMTVAQGVVTPQQFGQASMPTTQMKNAEVRASLTHEEMPALQAEIDDIAKDKDMGPVMGRWNDFIQGRIGLDNPKFAAFRADLLFMSSSVALMHAYGRLPENLRVEFDHMINAPQQSPANLKAVLTHVDKWVTDNMRIMGGGHGQVQQGQPQGQWDPKTGRYK